MHSFLQNLTQAFLEFHHLCDENHGFLDTSEDSHERTCVLKSSLEQIQSELTQIRDHATFLEIELEPAAAQVEFNAV